MCIRDRRRVHGDNQGNSCPIIRRYPKKEMEEFQGYNEEQIEAFLNECGLGHLIEPLQKEKFITGDILQGTSEEELAEIGLSSEDASNLFAKIQEKIKELERKKEEEERQAEELERRRLEQERVQEESKSNVAQPEEKSTPLEFSFQQMPAPNQGERPYIEIYTKGSRSSTIISLNSTLDLTREVLKEGERELYYNPIASITKSSLSTAFDRVFVLSLIHILTLPTIYSV
eukprot:TRINITY_DN14005_c0_g1_i2.p1 TRINITY_DN14005_c0_g1~~TRINITY_DN14005_c0_g1_i2.p1  ORF type:complete len:249 (-),score=66.97 TRINITY_DN14005_c0_g1_i2:34-723(-)